METNIHFWPYLAQFLEWGKIETQILFDNFFKKSCHLLDNVEKCRASRPQIQYGTCAMYGIWKATVTHLEYVILIAFPL